MTPRTGRDAPALTRRTTLALCLGGGLSLATVGCAVHNPLEEQRTPAAEAVRRLAPDVAVAVETVTLLRGADSAATTTGARHPALAPRVAGLLDTHRAHLAAVVDAVPDGVDTTASGAPYVVPARPALALAQLVRTEHALHDSLVGLAMRAQSGAFARLLGAMAAAVSQRLKELGA